MSYITRVLSRPVNKPFRTGDLQNTVSRPPFLDENGIVAFDPDGDIENPRDWSKKRRWTITCVTILLVMNATFASSAPSGAFQSMAREFDVSIEVAGLTITLFLLGYVAGPLVFAPLSEFFGRRYIFYSTFLLYLAFNFLCAFAPNIGSLLVGRFLTGTFVSAPLTNGPGLMADLWGPLERGNAMALFASFLWIGPALGPVIAGFLDLKEDWRWVFYVMLMLGGFSAIFMFTIPETYAPTLLYKRAKRIREMKIPGYENVKAPLDNASLVQMYKVALTRPWLILFDTISFLTAIYMSVVYTLLYMLFSIYPIVFQEKRGWNSGVGELPLIGTIVGASLGALIVVYDTNLRKKKIERGEMTLEQLEPEDRLPLGMIGGIGFAITMFWFAWTAEYNSVHWIVPTIAGGFLSTSLLLIFVAYLSYLVDVYLMYAASAMAANTIARSACGSAAPLFTNQMFSKLGVGGGGSLIGGVAALLAVIPFLFYKYGKQIRIKSRFAPTQAPPKRQPDLERDAPAAEARRSSDTSSTVMSENRDRLVSSGAAISSQELKQKTDESPEEDSTSHPDVNEEKV